MNEHQTQRGIKALNCGILALVVFWAGCSSPQAMNRTSEREVTKQPTTIEWNGQAMWVKTGLEHVVTSANTFQRVPTYMVPVTCTGTGENLLIILSAKESNGSLDRKKVKATIDGKSLELAGMLLASAEHMADMRKSGTIEVTSCSSPSMLGFVGSPNQPTYALLYKLPPKVKEHLEPGLKVMVKISGVADCPMMSIAVAAP